MDKINIVPCKICGGRGRHTPSPGAHEYEPDLSKHFEPTQYTRPDGLTLLRVGRSDLWVLRKIEGPSWFFHPETREWVIGTTVGLGKEPMTTFARPLATWFEPKLYRAWGGNEQ